MPGVAKREARLPCALARLRRGLRCYRQPFSPALQNSLLDLTETGRGLKVQTQKPHLVSLGSGRLSTAITLLPLEEGMSLQSRGPSLPCSPLKEEGHLLMQSPCRQDGPGLHCWGHCATGGWGGPPALLH